MVLVELPSIVQTEPLQSSFETLTIRVVFGTITVAAVVSGRCVALNIFVGFVNVIVVIDK